jgi:hypothetical protein
MASTDDTLNPSADNLPLIEATDVSATADTAMNAVRLVIVDPSGKGVRCLVSRSQARRLLMGLTSALAEFLPVLSMLAVFLLPVLAHASGSPA